MQFLKTMALATVAAIGISGGAMAAPIAIGSQISISGSDSFTATSVTFSNPAGIGGMSGSFLAAGLTNCFTCVTMTSFTNASATPLQLFSVLQGALSASLSVLSFDPFSYTAGGLPRLDVTGSGMLSLTGYDPTPGVFALTTQGPGGATVTFSVTSVAVPEPASLMLLGSGLLGLAALRRRRAAAAV